MVSLACWEMVPRARRLALMRVYVVGVRVALDDDIIRGIRGCF